MSDLEAYLANAFAKAFANAFAKGMRMFNKLPADPLEVLLPVLQDLFGPERKSIPEQSIFTNYDDLASYGYIERDPSNMDSFTLEPLRKCLEWLGVDPALTTDGGLNTRIWHDHAEDVTKDGVKYPKTGGHFAHIVNRDEGVLISTSTNTASNQGSKYDPPIKDIAPLHYWSDIAYLQAFAPRDTSTATATASTTPLPSKPGFDLKYVIRYCCQAPSTNYIVKHILASQHLKQLPEWPGLEFRISPTLKEGLALLGTPDGAAVVWLLAQHREQLGEKRVTAIRVFFTAELNYLDQPTIVFTVEGPPGNL